MVTNRAPGTAAEIEGPGCRPGRGLLADGGVSNHQQTTGPATADKVRAGVHSRAALPNSPQPGLRPVFLKSARELPAGP